MAFNAKMFGNALANRMRGMSENTMNQTENPENTPEQKTFDVPIASIGGSQEGDTFTVRVVSLNGETATLEKVEEEGMENAPAPKQEPEF